MLLMYLCQLELPQDNSVRLNYDIPEVTSQAEQKVKLRQNASYGNANLKAHENTAYGNANLTIQEKLAYDSTYI